MSQINTARRGGARQLAPHATSAEQQVFQRVLDALLREDHLGLTSNGQLAEPDWWQVDVAGTRLRLPVRPDGFQHALRTSRPSFVVEAGDGVSRVIATLDGLLNILTPTGDPQAEAGWAVFRTECQEELAARRLAAESQGRVYAAVTAARADQPTGMAGALLDETLAAHADHPVHPTSRCRHGLDDAELLAYAPEHAPTFALRWLSVSRTELTLSGALPSWWPAAKESDTVLVPAHPLTVDRLGLAVADGPEMIVTPTLSMRTVALADDPYIQLKLPLATATLGARNKRTIAPGTLTDGAQVQLLLQRIAGDEPAFAHRILHADETVFGHTGDDQRSFLLRRYPTDLAHSIVVPIAGLAATDPTGVTVAERVAGGDPGPLLDAYLDLLIDWHVYLWLRHGIALEAHQQNIHLVLNPSGEVRLLYKDNDGARIDARHAIALDDARMHVTDPGELADVFTTITLHLSAAAPLLALAERGLAMPSPATALRHRLVAARDRWGDGAAARLFTHRLLDADHLPVKAMLTAGTLLPKHRIGCTDINKYYLRTGPNYLRAAR
jgi:siderophore synthetase component